MLAKFLKKTVVAVITIPILFVLLYLGGWWLLLPVMGVALVGMDEYYTATRRKGHRPSPMLGYVTGIMILGVTHFSPPELREGTLLAFIILLVGGALALQFGNRPDQSAVNNSAITAFGVIYVPLMLSFIIRLRQIDLPLVLGHTEALEFWHRAGAVLFVMVPVWCCDTVAMAVGGAWGRHKLAPTISPAKTVEGSVAGFVAAIIGGLAVGVWGVGMPWYHALILGAFEGVVGQLGDLGKSVLKRDIGVKDFGTLFGAHGGVLDRLDSMMSCLPPVYLYLWLFFGAGR